MIVKRSISTSRIRYGKALEESILSFLSKFKKQQNNSSSHLIGTVEYLLDKYQHKIANKLDTNGKEITQRNDLWLQLTTDLEDIKIRKKRSEMVGKGYLKPPKIQYNKFLKALYPVDTISSLSLTKKEKIGFDFISQNKKIKHINHFNLFKTYSDLPQPRPLHIKPEHLNDLLEKFLTIRNFIKPNALSKTFEKPSQIMISTYNQMLNKRFQYVEMCSTILHDLKEVSIPLTSMEQNRILFLTFFKDKDEILQKIDKASRDEIEDKKLLQYNRFNMEIFNSIVSSYDGTEISIDTYNILLFHAIRHNQSQIISRILEDINLHGILEIKDLNNNINANHDTFVLLLDYFSSEKFLKSNRLFSIPFTNTINCFTKANLSIDIKIINSIMNGLISLREIDLAERFISEIVNNTDFNENEDKISLYKRLTGEDKIIYDKYINAIEKLKHLIDEDVNFSFKVTINEGIFRKLLSYYCSKESKSESLDKAFYLLSTMEEKYKLPITTRIFTMIFDKFISENQHYTSRWNMKLLIEVTTKLICCHDQYYSINEDTNFIKKLDGLNMYPQLNKFVEAVLKPNKKVNIPKHRANVLKLSDALIDKIYMAFQLTVKNNNDIDENTKSRLLKQIELQKLDLYKYLESTRGQKPNFYHDHPTRKNIYNIDETNYVKKGFIIDLIDLLCIN